MRRPTILFMNRVFPPVRGASGRVLRDLARSFAREGWHVTVISSGPEAGETREVGIRIIRVKGPEKTESTLSYMWVWLKMMYIALRLKSRHVLVTMTDPPLMVYAGYWISRLKKSHHIHWCQDLYPEIMPALGKKPPGIIYAVLQNLRQTAMKKATKIIVNGRCMAKYLTEEGKGIYKIAFVPNWPDLELTDTEMNDFNEAAAYQEPAPDLVRPFEQQLKSGQRFRVLYAGNIGLAHPIETIIEAAEKLDAQKSDVEFVFIGDGPRFDFIMRERSRRGLENIRILPFQPIEKLREVMESGDIHLMSMHEDSAGFMVPSKLYAALAVARPCILVGSKLSETAKVLRDFKAGEVVVQGDADALVAAILKFRESGDEWFLAHRGAVRAREVYAPQNTIEQWMEHAWYAVKDDLGV